MSNTHLLHLLHHCSRSDNCQTNNRHSASEESEGHCQDAYRFLITPTTKRVRYSHGWDAGAALEEDVKTHAMRDLFFCSDDDNAVPARHLLPTLLNGSDLQKHELYVGSILKRHPPPKLHFSLMLSTRKCSILPKSHFLWRCFLNLILRIPFSYDRSFSILSLKIFFYFLLLLDWVIELNLHSPESQLLFPFSKERGESKEVTRSHPNYAIIL